MYENFNAVQADVYHNIYYLNDNNHKVWLAKTPAENFYISKIPTKNGKIKIEVQSESVGGKKGKIIRKSLDLFN